MAKRSVAIVFMKKRSVRVPGKNIRNMCGKPLLMHVLETLQKSIIDRVIVNTDCDKIAVIAKAVKKVEVQVRSQQARAATTNEANILIAEALALCEEEDVIINTHTTNPCLQVETVNSFIDDFQNKPAKISTMFSVSPLQARLYDGNGEAFNHSSKNLVPTQNLAALYLENSCLYGFDKSGFTKYRSRIYGRSQMYRMPSWEAIDIDTEADWLHAEYVLRGRQAAVENC